MSRLYYPKGKSKRCHTILSTRNKSCLKPKLTCVFHFWKIIYHKDKNVRIWGFHNNATLNVILLFSLSEYSAWNSVVCEILPAAHVLTGCDTTSSFFGIGKKSMLKALKETPNQFSDLSRIEYSSKNMLFKCVFTRRKSHQSRIFDSCQFYPQFVQIVMASFRLSLRIIQP
jgi:hypothetical protein